MSERLTEEDLEEMRLKKKWGYGDHFPVLPVTKDIRFLFTQIAALRARAEQAETANKHMVEQIRSWKGERKQTRSYARAAAFLGVEREKTRELVERLVAWVEQTAGEDIPVVSEARSWLDKDWGATLPKEARPVAVMGFWKTLEAERDALRADLQEAREAVQMLMEWIGPPPAGPHEFDSLREDAWAKARVFLSRTAPKERRE